jgi:hypothetical protein
LAADRPVPLKTLSDLKRVGETWLLQDSTEGIWQWDPADGFRVLENQAPTEHLETVWAGVTDNQGVIWYLKTSWNGSPQVYGWNQKEWLQPSISGLPKDCKDGQLIIANGSRMLIDCKGEAPYVVEDGQAKSMGSLFPELNFKDQSVSLVRMQSSQATSIFLNIIEEHGQKLMRYDFRTGDKTVWNVVQDNRVLNGLDVILSAVPMEEILINPRDPQQFLIRTVRFILRPDNGQIVVAMDANNLLKTRIALTFSTNARVLSFVCDPFGEMWLLIDGLGLIRYDRIWEALDPEPVKDTPAEPIVF